MSVELNGQKNNDDAGAVIPELAGMSFEEFKRVVTEEFHNFFGRYENTSGTMFFEVYHSDTPPNGMPQETGVRWRQGRTDSDEADLAIDMVASVPAAIAIYQDTANKGYTRVFEALTESDMVKAREKHRLSKSMVAQEGLLGTYRYGKAFIRVSEYEKNSFTIDKGYDSAIESTMSGLSEENLRNKLESFTSSGFVKEGSSTDEMNTEEGVDREEVDRGLDFLASMFK